MAHPDLASDGLTGAANSLGMEVSGDPRVAPSTYMLALAAKRTVKGEKPE